MYYMYIQLEIHVHVPRYEYEYPGTSTVPYEYRNLSAHTLIQLYGDIQLVLRTRYVRTGTVRIYEPVYTGNGILVPSEPVSTEYSYGVRSTTVVRLYISTSL